MTPLTLLILQIGFVVLLWFFVFAVVYALRTDMFGERTRTAEAAAPARATPAVSATRTEPREAPVSAAPAPRASGQATVHNVTHLIILEGTRAGERIELGRDPLTIGRSSDCGLTLKDEFTSSQHARLMLWNDDWMIQDLDSTNGTFLGKKRISSPTPVPLGSAIKVGRTSFELRG